MKEIRKEDINQKVFDLYDDYAHDRIDRREFLDKISAYAVGGVTVASLLSFIMPNYKDNIQVQKDDPRLKSEFISYESPFQDLQKLTPNFPVSLLFMKTGVLTLISKM